MTVAGARNDRTVETGKRSPKTVLVPRHLPKPKGPKGLAKFSVSLAQQTRKHSQPLHSKTCSAESWRGSPLEALGSKLQVGTRWRRRRRMAGLRF